MKYLCLHQTSSLCSAALLLALGTGFSQTASANPHGGQVAAGSASIQQSGTKLEIHQHSNRAIIDWRGFDIAPGEHTQFHQPSAGATALNRVNSPSPSRIAGKLSANGNVILINPNGVFFEGSSRVDVNSLIVTTADINNDAFMAGKLAFSKPGTPDAAIINKGQITAKEAGLVGLVAPHVENKGVITAKLGKVELAAADTFGVDLYGDGLYNIGISDAVTSQLVDNSGYISAEGGTIALTAAQGREIVDSLITVSGELNAPTIAQKGGKIIIGAATDAPKSQSTVRVSGTVAANGSRRGEKGGNITITGDRVALEDYANVDASGQTGGGTVKIGGDYQGTGDTLTANKTYIGENATVTVDATAQGDGGTAIIWADDSTQFYGTVFARGAGNGNGGFAEISGKRVLEFLGNADLSGKAYGTLLLDPNIINIDGSATNPAEFGDDSVAFAENGVGTTTIGAGILGGRLTAGANVILQANTNINVNSAVTSTGGGNLTLQTGAGGTVAINQPITMNTGGLTVLADEIDIAGNLSGAGAIKLNSANAAQAIEIGSTNAARLNLTAVELGFL